MTEINWCVCDGRYDGCEHANPCREPNDGTNRGPWCALCQPRRLDALRLSLQALREDLRA
jgi:hypothetical protein